MNIQYYHSKEFYLDLEKDLMFYIIINLKKSKLSPERAKTLAADFLLIKALKSPEEALQYLATKISIHPEMHEVYLKYAPQYYAMVKSTKLERIHECMQCEDLEEALKVVHEVQGQPANALGEASGGIYE